MPNSLEDLFYRTCEEMSKYILENSNGFNDVDTTICYFMQKAISNNIEVVSYGN